MRVDKGGVEAEAGPGIAGWGAYNGPRCSGPLGGGRDATAGITVHRTGAHYFHCTFCDWKLDSPAAKLFAEIHRWSHGPSPGDSGSSVEVVFFFFFYSPLFLLGFACFLRLHLGPSAMILSLCLNAAGESPPLSPLSPPPPRSLPPCLPPPSPPLLRTWFTTLRFTTSPSRTSPTLAAASTAHPGSWKWEGWWLRVVAVPGQPASNVSGVYTSIRCLILHVMIKGAALGDYC